MFVVVSDSEIVVLPEVEGDVLGVELLELDKVDESDCEALVVSDTLLDDVADVDREVLLVIEAVELLL